MDESVFVQGEGVEPLPPCPTGLMSQKPRFDVVVVDPPWPYGSLAKQKRHGGRGGQAAMHYSTITSYSDIIDTTPIDQWTAENAHLYLWTTNPKLPFAFSIMEQWGFTYKTTLTWVKQRKDGEVHGGGMGWFFRGATEHVLFGVRGHKPIPSALRRPNVIEAPKGKHSAKPDAFYEMLDSISHPNDRKLDVYCRGLPRKGWWGWGNEAQSVNHEVKNGA